MCTKDCATLQSEQLCLEGQRCQGRSHRERWNLYSFLLWCLEQWQPYYNSEGRTKRLHTSWSKTFVWLIHWNNSGSSSPMLLFYERGEKPHRKPKNNPMFWKHSEFFTCLFELLLLSSFLSSLQDCDPSLPWSLLTFFTPREKRSPFSGLSQPLCSLLL